MRTKVVAATAALLCLLEAASAFVCAHAAGWSFHQSLNAYVVSNILIGVAFELCGSLVAWHRPRHPVGWLYVVGGLCQTTTALASPAAQLVHDHGGPNWVLQLLVTVFGWAWPVHIGIALPLSLLLLPDGILPSPRWKPVFLAVAISAPLFVVETGTAPHQLAGLPDGFLVLPRSGGWAVLWSLSELRWVLSVVIGLVALFVRYRRGDSRVRAQLLWLLAAVAVVLLAVTPFALVAGTPLVVVFTIPLLPAAITVAILRHGLLDIRLVFARGLTYGLLSAVVLALYALLVLALSGVASALLAALVALPLRGVLQSAVDRVMYGDRRNPARVAAQVGDRLGDLASGLEAVRDAMRWPYVAIVADDHLLAEAGEQPAAIETVPLSPSASLRVGLRRGEHGLAAADVRILRLLAGPLAVAVTATVTSRELQASREQLVTAREEERRRLRAELHDGLGPLLSGAALATDAVANVSRSSPEDAAELLRGVRTDLRTAIAEVRRVVDDLRPGALELGLVAALQVRASRAVSRSDGSALSASVAAENLGTLPAAVEVAAFRIATEALTNVVRHSTAARVEIRLRTAEGALCVDVLDDGDHTPAWVPGVGLSSMRARTEELGGSWSAGSTPEGGCVRARLPLAAA